MKSLITSNWFSGPSYIWQRSLPDEAQIDSNLSDNDHEVRAQVMQTTMTLDNTNIFDRFSSWFTAVQVISNCLKFKDLVKEQKDAHAELDAVEQIQISRLCVIRCLQRNVYYDEIQLLSDGKYIPTNNKLPCCCCLPTPMALASGGSPMFPPVVHQPASPSIWPAVQSLRRGLSTNPGATMWCVCGCS